MTLHWAHITASYALVALGFGGLAIDAWRRHAVARRRLAALDPREMREARR